jgi:hypothetical protein
MKKNPFSFPLFHLAASFITGLIGIIIYKEVFTAATFAETALVILPVLYTLSKITVAKTIRKYQDFGFQPSAPRRRRDDLWVNLNIHIVMPLSLELAYAAMVLFILKLLPENIFTTAGKVIQPVLDLKEKYLQLGIAIVFIMIGILTYLRYISVVKYKNLKTFRNYVVFPLKVVTILAFFVQADAGLNTRQVEYVLNARPVRVYEPTLNAATEKDSKIQEATTSYIDYLVDKFESELAVNDIEENPVGEDQRIVPNLMRLAKLSQSFPEVRPEAYNEVKTKVSVANIPAVDEVNNFETWSTHTNTKTFNSNLYEQANSKNVSFFDDFILMMQDNRKSIKKTVISANGEILKAIIGDAIGELLPFKKITERIPLHKLFNDKTAIMLKDKVAESLSLFFTKESINSTSFRKTFDRIEKVIGKYYKSARTAIQPKANILRQFSAAMNRSALDNFFKVKEANQAHRAMPLTEGWKLRKVNLSATTGKYERYLNDFFANILQQYPDISRDRIYELLRPEYKAHVDEIQQMIRKQKDDLTRLDDLLTGKLEKSFVNFRDISSPGGIFFGTPVMRYQDLREGMTYGNVCQSAVIPAIKQCPDYLLREEIIGLYIDNGKLHMQTASSHYTFTSVPDKKLMLAAFRYVYDARSYPAIVDGFYDSLGQKVFAFNDVLCYDHEITQMFLKADEFIFNVLDSTIDEVRDLNSFKPALSAYHAIQGTGKVSQSRIYDQASYISTYPDKTFDVHLNLKFSVASHQNLTPEEISNKSRYHEVHEVSDSFNANKLWISDTFGYMKDLNTFAMYQALFRSVDQMNVDISELLFE